MSLTWTLNRKECNEVTFKINALICFDPKDGPSLLRNEVLANNEVLIAGLKRKYVKSIDFYGEV